MWRNKTKYTNETYICEHYCEAHVLFLFTTLEQKYSQCESVYLHACECLCVCVPAGEGWEKNLALDFMPDGPIFKNKKK